MERFQKEAKAHQGESSMILCSGAEAPNNTLQVTFDPLPTFAVAKAVIASNAPERGRYVDSL